MSQAFRCRPSELVGITDPFSAYCLDEVAYVWGSYVEDAVEQAKDKAKDQKEATRRAATILKSLLSEPAERTDENVVALPPPKRQFRDPAAMFSK